MTIQIAKSSLPFISYSPKMDLDHIEQGWSVIAEGVVDPLNNTLFYFLPWLGAFFSSCIEVREDDPAQGAMMPHMAKASILQEVKQLTKAARIVQSISLYTSLKHSFSSYGGSLSLSAPALCVPYQYLFRPEKNAFTQESSKDSFATSLWNYSDDETIFLISRELGRMKEPISLIRIAIKISVIALTGLFGGWLVATVSVIAIHCLIERNLQQKMDVLGIDIMALRFGNQKRAQQAALGVLHKMQSQNLFRSKHNRLCLFYITEKGDNLLDWTHYSLTSRIERVQKVTQKALENRTQDLNYFT